MKKIMAVAVALALWTSSLHAQTGDWAAVQGLASGTDISVKTLQGKKYQGEMEAVDFDSITVWSQEKDFPGRKLVRRELARAEVKQVRLNHRMWSVAAGAGIGAGIGVGIGAAVDAHYSSNEDHGVLGVILGFLGAGIGAAIAKSHPFISGKTIYLAP